MRQMIVGLLVAVGVAAIALQLVKSPGPGAVTRADLDVRMLCASDQPDLQEAIRVALPDVQGCLREAGFHLKEGTGKGKPLPLLQIALSRPQGTPDATPGRVVSLDIVFCEDPRSDSLTAESGNALWSHGEFRLEDGSGGGEVALRVVREVRAFIARHGLSPRPEPENPRRI